MKKFVEKLAKIRAPKDARNPWNFSVNTNEIRRKNLEGYLNKMAGLKPNVLLVGEAPGYRGCGRVGMPFSSEKIVLSHPFHPHKANDIFSNRAPRPDEVVLGREFLKEMLRLFKIKHILAVGKVAERSLAEMGYTTHPIRHPSHGGANLFAQGLKDFVKSL